MADIKSFMQELHAEEAERRELAERLMAELDTVATNLNAVRTTLGELVGSGKRKPKRRARVAGTGLTQREVADEVARLRGERPFITDTELKQELEAYAERTGKSTAGLALRIKQVRDTAAEGESV